MQWERFQVPEFDYSALRNMVYEPRELLSSREACDIASRHTQGEAAAYGAYLCEPGPALVERFNFQGQHATAILCILPKSGARLLARSRAWFRQRLIILDDNGADGNVLHEWKTPRPFNTRLGPDDGVVLEHPVIWILSGRILDDQTRANRVMADALWKPDGERAGFRIVAANDTEKHQFHECCIEVSWSE